MDAMQLVASGGLVITLCWICICDIRSFRIPNTASLGLLVAGLLLNPWLAVTAPMDAVIGALLGYCTFAALGAFHFHRTQTEALGLGDAKLLAAAGAWLGWTVLPQLVGLAAISALIFGLLSGQSKLAFGPWLSMSFWMHWLVAVNITPALHTRFF